MKRILMTLAPAFWLTFGVVAARADEAPAKPDCSAQKKASDEANAAAKAASAKPDLSSCKDTKGKDKTDCEKPLKDKAKSDAKSAKDNAKAMKTALDCCKNPKKKGGCNP
jgi:hypothetical protein